MGWEKKKMPLKDEGRFDEVFLPVLTHLGKMDQFLDHVFSFLFRRTDFYYVMKTKHDSMGFPPGAAERMVNTVGSCVNAYVKDL